MGWRRRMRSEMDALWAAADNLNDWIKEWDRAADAAMLEPGAPQVPEPSIPPQRPAPIMGRTGYDGCE